MIVDSAAGNRGVSNRISHEEEAIHLEELLTEDNREMITNELMVRGRSPNRIGTMYKDAFVKDALDQNLNATNGGDPGSFETHDEVA